MRAPLAPASLAAEAYDFVKQRILRGELPMGQVISRRKIAAELGMSFLPVSEALLRLEFEGLLESRPRAGTRVRIPSREDVRGHYIVREALGSSSRQTVRRGRMRRRSDRTAEAGDRASMPCRFPNSPSTLPAHEKLHRRIAEGARCPALSIAIEKTHALASTWFCVARRTRATSSTRRRHQNLSKILVSGAPDEAAEAMRQHVNRGMENAMARLKPYFRIRKAFGQTYFRSEKRQKQQLIDPSAWN